MSQSPSLRQLHEPNAFLRRHLGPDAQEQQAMLEALGVAAFHAQVRHSDRRGARRVTAPTGRCMAGRAMEGGEDGERAQR